MKKSLSLQKALEKSQASSQLTLELHFEEKKVIPQKMPKKDREFFNLLCGKHASKSTKKHRLLR